MKKKTVEKPKTKQKHFGIRLPYEMYLDLESIAEENTVSVAQVIRAIIDISLDRYREK